MKLTSIEIQNYRSLSGDSPLELELASGVNSIVGPNNVGKSNIFRALATAFEAGPVFDWRKDWPPNARNAKPTVTMTFKLPDKGRTSSERTLARYLKAYESKVNSKARTHLIDKGEVRFRVVMENRETGTSGLNQHFMSAGAGARYLSENDDLHRKALQQFKRCVRFVYIESGQDLASLLEGKFRDILAGVLKEHRAQEFDAARLARENYLAQLQSNLLEPLTRRISDELKELVPEISGVTLEPYVGNLDETLTRMRISVSDAAVTDLADKGTGVRGGVMIAMLRHLADEGRQSMVFAVEEPEAFLHPAGQECMLEDLQAISRKDNVSLLVSTHSPFIVSRDASARIFALAKDARGRTYLETTADGTEPHAATVGSLFRSRLVVEVLDRSQRVGASAKGILVVEGYTDHLYLRTAARLLDDETFLDDVAIIEAGYGLPAGAGGASLCIMQALVARATSNLPVVVLLDADDEGSNAYNQLARISSKTGDWKKGGNLLQYCDAFQNGRSSQFPLIAEDLWPNRLVEAFLSRVGKDGVLSGQVARKNPIGGWQYHLKTDRKVEFADFVDRTAQTGDTAHWRRIIEMIRSQLATNR